MALPIFQRTVTDNKGNIVVGATVTVKSESTGLVASIFSDRAGSAALSNPFTTGADGLASFYAAPGEYRIEVASGAFALTWRYQVFEGDIATKAVADFSVKVASVSDLASATLVAGQAVELIGYHDGTTVGGGSGVIKIARHNGGTAISLTREFPSDWTDQAQLTSWFADSGSDELCFVRTDHMPLSLTMFGVNDSEKIDIPLSTAINYSKANGFIDVNMDITDWTISSQMPQLNSSFNAVKLIGSHGSGGVSKGTCDTITEPHFKYSGGSGGHAGELMRNLSISKTTNGALIENKGLCGASSYNCQFSAQIIAALSNDIGTGTFTEFFIFKNCELNCEQVFTFERGAGNDSFHGCGIDDHTVVNQRDTAVNPLFYVGTPADGSNRIVWYNAPLSSQVFTRGNQSLIGCGNTGNNILTSSGNLTVELFNSEFVVSTFKHYHAGDIATFSKGLFLGKTVQVYNCQVGSSGKVIGLAKPQSIRFVKPGDGTTDVNIGAQLERSIESQCAYYISVSAPNYEYAFRVECAGRISASIPPSAVKDDSIRSFNASGFGSPTVSMLDSSLIVSNTNWGNASVTFRVTLLDHQLDWSEFAPEKPYIA